MELNDNIRMQSNHLQSKYQVSEHFVDGCADSTGESKEIRWDDRKLLQALHHLFATFSYIFFLKNNYVLPRLSDKIFRSIYNLYSGF